MKPELRPGLRRQERRQAGERRIDQHRDPPLGERADLAERERDDVGGEGDRLGVKVAARQRLVVLGEDQRIVGDARWLRRRAWPRPGAGDRDRRPSPAAGSAGNRDPAPVGSPVRCEARIALPAISARKRRGDLDLAAMASQRMDARVERRVRAARGVGRQRAGRRGPSGTASPPRTGRRARSRSRTACR